MRRPLVVLAAVAAVLVAAVAPASAGAPGGTAGYAATTTTFTSVTATWTLPTVTCTSDNDLVTMWDGLDGYGASSTVEQIGVSVDCSSRRAIYLGFYEMYPSAPVYLSSSQYPLSAGDRVTSTVTHTAPAFTLTLKDTTRGWAFTSTKSLLSGRGLSAEVIVEAPTPPKFGSVTFTTVLFNGLNFGAFNPTGMDGGSLHTGPIVNGNSFTVTEE
jgi:hypothetical protein